MQSGTKLTLVCGALAALILSLAPAAPDAAAAGAATSSPRSPSAAAADQLRARRADLEKQLATATGAGNDAKQLLLGAQHQLAGVAAQLAATRRQLDTINAELRGLTQTIATASSGLETEKAQLGALVRVAFESSDTDGFANAVLASGSFGDAMAQIRAAQSITDQVGTLEATVGGKERSLVDARGRLQADFASAQTLEGSLADQSGELMALVGQRDQAVQQFSGPARSLAAQIASIDDQLSSQAPAAVAPPRVASSTPGPAVNGSAPCGNRFAWGNCTYYVATRRCIPWLGNAYQWYSAAAAAGYAEGSQPRRGAVVVWGISRVSPVGHVAFVEAVGPAGGVPAGSFLVSEMNVHGLGVVSTRIIPIGSSGILGFIYGQTG